MIDKIFPLQEAHAAHSYVMSEAGLRQGHHGPMTATRFQACRASGDLARATAYLAPTPLSYGAWSTSLAHAHSVAP